MCKNKCLCLSICGFFMKNMFEWRLVKAFMDGSQVTRVNKASTMLWQVGIQFIVQWQTGLKFTYKQEEEGLGHSIHKSVHFILKHASSTSVKSSKVQVRKREGGDRHKNKSTLCLVLDLKKNLELPCSSVLHCSIQNSNSIMNPYFRCNSMSS